MHLPGIYVKRVVQSTTPKRIEKITNARPTDTDGAAAAAAAADMSVLGTGATAAKRARIVRRAAREFTNGMYANLGIGMPMLAPAFVPAAIEIQLQSENGILGVGASPAPGAEDADLINAGKEPITLAAGASVFGSAESFGMIRAGRIDLTVLGALANWMRPGRIKGFGGAVDLVANPGRTRVVVTMEH